MAGLPSGLMLLALTWWQPYSFEVRWTITTVVLLVWGGAAAVSFQMVQRALFLQQDTLALNRGSLTQNLVALYKAMGGGWEPARSRPVLDPATLDTMNRRSDWTGLLEDPLPPPGTGPTPPERQK